MAFSTTQVCRVGACPRAADRADGRGGDALEETSQRVARARTMNSTQLEFVSQGNLMPKYVTNSQILLSGRSSRAPGRFWRRVRVLESPPAVPRLLLYLHVLPPRAARAVAGLGRAGVGRPRLGCHAGRGLRAGEPSTSGEPPAELAAVSEPGLTRGAASARLSGHRRRAR